MGWEQGREGQVAKDHRSSEYGEASEFHYRQVRHCRYQMQVRFNVPLMHVGTQYTNYFIPGHRDREAGARVVEETNNKNQ